MVMGIMRLMATSLGEISGQDIIDLNEARQAERDAAENERNPVKNAKDAKDAKNAKDAADAKEARDDDAKEVGGEEGPSGLVDLAFAGLGVVMSAGAAFLAGGGSSSASPSGSAGGQSGAGNGVIRLLAGLMRVMRILLPDVMRMSYRLVMIMMIRVKD
jgi:membrane protein involved in colicin uptake